MKKITVLLLAIFVAAGTAAAQEGLYLGAEFEVQDFSEFGDTIGTNAYVGYEMEIIENLDLFAEGSVNIPMSDWGGFYGDTAFWLEAGVQYTLDFGLFFGSSVNSLLFCSLKGVDPFDLIGIDVFVGYEGENYLGQLTLENYIRDEFYDTSFLYGLELYGYYEFGQFIPGLSFWVPLYKDGIDYEGMCLTPEFTFRLNEHFDFYVQAPISGIGTKKIKGDDDIVESEGGIAFGIVLGAKFSF